MDSKIYKKGALFIFSIFCFIFYFSNSFAQSDAINNHTLIDCIDWDDEKAVAFDDSKPYQSLKAWIEKSIEYINTNINKVWNEQSASWMTFKIKINCTTNDLSSDMIRLNFDGETYKNELLLEWVWENSFVVQSFYFYIPDWTWKIIFKNTNFWDNSKHWKYFLTPNQNRKGFNWIKIIDSIINIKPWTQFWAEYYFWRWSFIKHFFSQIVIKNSIINVDISSDYTFKNIFLIKDSNINFKKTHYTLDPYIIKFETDWYFKNSSFISNQIDFWWNNFDWQQFHTTTYINNKFKNFKKYNFLWWNWSVYFNNTFENEEELDISDTKFFINNIFKWNFKNDNDKNNLRKNYNVKNIWNKWIWWFFKIKNNIKYFNIDLSVYSLYKEITGKELEIDRNSIHVIYNN